VSEEVNRKCPPKKMTVQFSIPYTSPKRYNADVTDGRTDGRTDRQRDDSLMTIANRAAYIYSRSVYNDELPQMALNSITCLLIVQVPAW